MDKNNIFILNIDINSIEPSPPNQERRKERNEGGTSFLQLFVYTHITYAHRKLWDNSLKSI